MFVVIKMIINMNYNNIDNDNYLDPSLEKIDFAYNAMEE
jgi:hypothetical protein